MRRSSSYSSLTSTSASSRAGSSVTTFGLGTMSGRAILALGEAVIRGTHRLTRRRRHGSVLSLESTVDSARPQDAHSHLSVSSESKSSSSTVPGPGELSGRAIKALGKLTLRGLDEIQLLIRLGKLRPFFPHGNRVFWEPDDGEEMYEELLDLTRPGLYSARVRRIARALLLSQIGFRELNQLIKALSAWDAESILQLLYNLLEAVLNVTGSLTKMYLRFQDAPQLDPLLPFATFLVQLSSASLSALQAAEGAGSFLLARLPNRHEPSLSYYLLQALVVRNPFDDAASRLWGMPLMPEDISQWKFSWLLSCVAYEGEYWDLCISTLARSSEKDRNSRVLQLVDCTLSLFSSDSVQEPINEHLLLGFLLACRQGAKSSTWVTYKDPLELTLRFLLRALSNVPDLRTVFGTEDEFLMKIRPCVLRDPAPAQEVLQTILESVRDGYLEDGTPKPDAEIARLCWEIYKVMRENIKEKWV